MENRVLTKNLAKHWFLHIKPHFFTETPKWDNHYGSWFQWSDWQMVPYEVQSWRILLGIGFQKKWKIEKSWKWVRLRWDWVCPGLWYMKRRNLMVPGPRGRVKVRISEFSCGFGVQRSFLSFTGPFFVIPKGTDPINEDPHLYGSAGSLFVYRALKSSFCTCCWNAFQDQ